jgi:acetyl esterase/lipase
MRKGLIFILAAVVGLFLSAGSIYAFQAPKVDSDVVYCNCQGLALKMDLYYPQPVRSALPVVLYIHGGGWYSGDKTSGVGQVDIPELVKRGYLVAAVNYRLAPRYPFPAQIEDVKCAVRYLRANAATYGLDPARIGVFGDSAGGHLAALLGVTDKSCGFDGCEDFLDQSSRVQAVVDMCGPSDLTLTFEQNWSMLIEHVFNTSDPESEIIKRASPVTYVSSDDAPFLIIHGNKDDQVLLNQSAELYSKLISCGVPAGLVVVENAGHEFVPAGGRISPSRAEITRLVGDFFDRYLQ